MTLKHLPIIQNALGLKGISSRSGSLERAKFGEKERFFMRGFCGFCFFLALLLFLSLWGPASLAGEATEAPQGESNDLARDAWMHGISLFEKGGDAETSGNFETALAFYQEAIKVFRKVKSDYPDWQPKFVDFRINRCLGKLEEISAALKKKHISVSNAAQENVLLRERMDEQEKKIVSLKAELSKTLEDLESLRRESVRDGRSASTLERIMREKAELEKKCALLEDANKRLLKGGHGAVASSGGADLDKALARAAELEKSNNQLRALLERGKTALDSMAEAKAKLEYELKISNASVEAIKRRLDATSEALKSKDDMLVKVLAQGRRSKESLLETQKALADANESITKLRASLKQIRTQSGDAILKQLQGENEMLVKDLELARLELDKVNKEKRGLRAKLDDASRKTGELGKLLALKDKQSTALANDLQTVRDKLFIANAVVKKQDLALAKETERYSKLKHDFDVLAGKSKGADDRNKDLLNFAKSEEKAEAENRRLEAKIKELEAANAKSQLEAKKAEKRLETLKGEYANLLVGNSKLEEKVAKLEDRAELADKLEARVKNMSQGGGQQDMDNALRVARDTEAENSALKKQIATLTAKFKELRKSADKASDSGGNVVSDEEMRVLRKENASLQAKLKDAAQRIATLESLPPPVSHDAAATTAPAQSSKNLKQCRELLKMAKEAEKNGTAKSAIWYYEKAFAINPDDMRVATRLGYAYAKAGNDEKAVEILTRVAAEDAENIDALLALTFCHIRRKEYYLALGSAAKANALRPKDPRILRYMGIVCENLGWKEAAQRQYETSFKLDPTSSKTAYNVASLLCGLGGRKKDAVSWYKKALELGAKRDLALEKKLKIRVRIKSSK